MKTGMVTRDVVGDLPHIAWLVPLDGPFAGELFRLGVLNEIGDGPPADILLPGAGLKTLHARFVSSGGDHSVLDIGDAGTYVNDQRITKASLVDSDVIRVGEVRLMYKSIGPLGSAADGR